MSGVIPIIPEGAPASGVTVPDVHVASLVVQVRPEARYVIEQQIERMPECTCYRDEPEGTPVRDSVLVVVMEVASSAEINSVITALNQLKGVLNVNLVYHYSDSAQSMTDEMEVSS